ncbi:MAG: class II fructose-bisphosphate aldolase [Holdemania massiliensis]
MLVSMKDILQHAHQHNYAVMAVNSINMEMARAVISAAEEEHSPIIVQMGPGQIGKHAHLTEIVPLVKELAERASIPVALNLDHGGKLEDMVTAIHNGFTSLMIDASSYPYEENVKRTSVVCALAHPHGICVEAELGHVGQAADGDNSKVDLYTNVEEAKQFVKDTGCDALAVAIGTAHGDYPKGYVPVLNFERLAELKKGIDMPCRFSHGGSGSGEENIRKAVAGGINKRSTSAPMLPCRKKCHAGKTGSKTECRLSGTVHDGRSCRKAVCEGIYPRHRFQQSVFLW